MQCKDNKGNSRKEEIRLFNDKSFKKVRDLAGLNDDFLIEFNFDTLKAGGGKGGDLMAFTSDGNFLVKEVKDVDQVSLEKYAKAYADHMSRGEGSLLCQFYKHFQRVSNSTNFVVMNNFLPSSALKKRGGREGVPGANGELVRGWDLKFDLKGCMDDKTQEKAGKDIVEVHKRFFKFWMFCCPCCDSDERQEYAQGKMDARAAKFHCTQAQQKAISTMIKADAAWIAKYNMMDHSLMVGIASHPKSKVDAMIKEGKSIIGLNYKDSIFPQSVLPDQPYICEHGKAGEERVYALYVGIIDYLQDWNGAKSCAKCIKVCAPHPKSTEPPDVYEDQFNELCKNFTTDGTDCAYLNVDEQYEDCQTRFDDMTEMTFRTQQELDEGFADSPVATPVDGHDCDQHFDYSTDFHERSAGPANETVGVATSGGGGWFGFGKKSQM